MNIFRKKSLPYYCYLFINFWWYLSWIAGTISIAVFIGDYFWNATTAPLVDISIPIKTSLVALKNPAQYSFLCIDAIKGQIALRHIIQNEPNTYLLMIGFICITFGLYLFGLYQLRNLLKATTGEDIFTKENVRRIKTIGILVILIQPLTWLQHHFIFRSFGNFIPAKSPGIDLQLTFPGPGLDFVWLGLLIFVLASIFEKGYEMYQELKLTV